MGIKALSVTHTDDELRGIVAKHLLLLQAQEFDPAEVINVFVMDPKDSSDIIHQSTGFSLLRNRYTNDRFDDPGFTPFWEYLVEHHYWYEMVCVLSDDGFGYVVFIPKSTQDGELLKLCQMYAQPE